MYAYFNSLHFELASGFWQSCQRFLETILTTAQNATLQVFKIGNAIGVHVESEIISHIFIFPILFCAQRCEDFSICSTITILTCVDPSVLVHGIGQRIALCGNPIDALWRIAKHLIHRRFVVEHVPCYDQTREFKYQSNMCERIFFISSEYSLSVWREQWLTIAFDQCTT